VAEELIRVGKHSPVTLLLAAMERHGLTEPGALLVDAVSAAPYAFAFYRL